MIVCTVLQHAYVWSICTKFQKSIICLDQYLEFSFKAKRVIIDQFITNSLPWVLSLSEYGSNDGQYGSIIIGIKYIHSSKQLTKMGNTFASISKKENFSEVISSMLDHIAHEKFASNQKTEALFMKQIEALCKKVSYVSSVWAKALFSFLTETHPSELYCYYLRVLQENCKVDKGSKIIFYAMKLRKIFLLQTSKKYNKKESMASVANLKELMHQAKTYFMVLSWLKKVASLNEETDEKTETFPIYRYEEKVYSFLIEFASKSYANFPVRQTQPQLERTFQCTPEFQNSRAVSLLKQISNCKYFHERQRAIESLQQTLLGDEQNRENYLFWIQKMFGRKKVFASLFVMREIGNIDVSYLWQLLYGTAYEKILE